MLQCIKDYADQRIDKKIAKLDANNVSMIRATLCNNLFTWIFVINKGRTHASQYSMGTGTRKVEECHL